MTALAPLHEKYREMLNEASPAELERVNEELGLYLAERLASTTIEDVAEGWPDDLHPEWQEFILDSLRSDVFFDMLISGALVGD